MHLPSGPPLPPHPKFHVVNATHIKVEWDKPFALPEYDVRNYTLTTSSQGITDTVTLEVSQDTDHPMSEYFNNRGDIPQDCVLTNFTLTATNDIGRSLEGFVTGGFAIGIFCYTDLLSFAYGHLHT